MEKTKKKTKDKINLKKVPIAVTVHKIGKSFIVDPSHEEEESSDARLTIASLKDGTLCALQKGGEYPLTVDDIGLKQHLSPTRSNGLVRRDRPSPESHPFGHVLQTAGSLVPGEGE